MVLAKVRNFGRVGDAIEVGNLAAVQKDGYDAFLQRGVSPTKRKCEGLEGLFQEIFPIESYDKSIRLEYLYYELDKPRYPLIKCRQLRLTYGYPLKVRCRLVHKDGEDLSEQSVYLGDMPVMIGGGEFVINGAERVIVSQLHRSPGVDFLVESKEGDRVLHGGRIIPERGSWIEINVTRKDVMTVKIDQSSKIPATVFLRALDSSYGTTEEIIRRFYPTKEVSVKRLKSDMWAVGPIVDTESGEVLVKAGAQIGDSVSVIRQSNIWTSAEATNRDVTDYMAKELEFKYYPISDLLKDGSKLKPLLEFIENRLMLEYPDTAKDDEKKRHLPRFNTENDKTNKDAGDEKKVQAFLKKWGKKATPEQQEILKACKEKIKDKSPWYSNPKDVEEADFKEPGLYFFRNKKTKKVNHGYIGIAGLKQDKGVHGRMVNSHYSENPGDSLRKSIRKFIKTEKPGNKNKKAGTVEVIEDVSDLLILNTLAEDDCDSREEAVLKFYLRLRPGNPPNEEKAKTFFEEKFFDLKRYRLGKVGRFRLNRKFSHSANGEGMTLDSRDFLNTMEYIVGLRDGRGEVDDIDHLGNRRIRTIDELASDEIRKGLLKLRRTIQERMSSRRDPSDGVRISDLMNSKSFSSSVNYFFGRGELSQVVDQTNALSQLTHERRMSALGPGGLNRRRAGFEVRDVHISHYGRICPIETPEGTNIGLISSLAIFATIDEYGFLLSPYMKVKNRKVIKDVDYLRADEDMKAVIASPSTIDRSSGKITDGRVLAMKGGVLAEVPSEEIDYVDVSLKQTLGVSASLIPFLEHDDANRALMGSNMQRQAVPLLKSEAPLVGTGMEKIVGRNSSMVVRAEKSGEVVGVDATKIVISKDKKAGFGLKQDISTPECQVYDLSKFVGLNERTCLNQRPVVQRGDKVKPGQVIADGGGTDNGELALGKNVLVGFMSFEGYNFEDAIVISEKLVKNDSFTSIHIDEFSAEVRETRIGKEEFTRDIPNVGEKALRNLDEHGVIREGARVYPGDILVGKVVPKSKTELTPEEKLLHAIFGRAGEDVKNDSLELPSSYEGVVIRTERFTRRGIGGDSQKKRVKAEVKEYEQKMRVHQCRIFREMISAIHDEVKVSIVDPATRQKIGISEDDEVIYEQIDSFDVKLVKPAAARAVVQKIVDKFWGKISELEEDKKGGIESIRHGDELPSGVLEMVKIYVAVKRTLSIGDKMAGRHGNKGVIARIVPEEDMPFLEDGTSLDILLNPLGVPSRMNVGQIFETHLGWLAKVLGFQAITPVFDGAKESDIQSLTEEANQLMSQRVKELRERNEVPGEQEIFVHVPSALKTRLYNGRTGEQFDQRVTVGYIYMMKLHHLVDDKIHARATGPYSLITQQPLGGKARTGGQRFGEMEVWALEGYGAAYSLQEMLTVKSDDVEGRTKIYESMVKGANVLEAGTPLSFDVLCNEIRGLGLNIELEKKRLGISVL